MESSDKVSNTGEGFGLNNIPDISDDSSKPWQVYKEYSIIKRILFIRPLGARGAPPGIFDDPHPPPPKKKHTPKSVRKRHYVWCEDLFYLLFSPFVARQLQHSRLEASTSPPPPPFLFLLASTPFQEIVPRCLVFNV